MDKKHEDAGGVAQIDKTSVFQEGRRHISCHLSHITSARQSSGEHCAQWTLTLLSSTSIQPEPYIAQEM